MKNLGVAPGVFALDSRVRKELWRNAVTDTAS
jgi:hypothetical protein